jgi:PhnB protein
MLADAFPQQSTRPPKELGGTSASLFLYLEDVDPVVQQAVDAGATVTTEVADQSWGDRFGTVTDPFGHVWSVATASRTCRPRRWLSGPRRPLAGMGSS